MEPAATHFEILPPLAPLERLGSVAPLEQRLRKVAAGKAMTFEHVVEAARPMLCALIARASERRTWIVCPDVRSQEALHNELLNWVPEALFFPEAEQALVEGALPDPETAAERLELVQKLGTPGKVVLVLTEKSLGDPVPAPSALRKLELRLERGALLDREKLIAQLDKAGFEHVPQVSLRGQYAVRGGILDVFSFNHALPLRIELFGDEIESLRQFDLDAQTSVHASPDRHAAARRRRHGQRRDEQAGGLSRRERYHRGGRRAVAGCACADPRRRHRRRGARRLHRRLLRSRPRRIRGRRFRRR